MSTVALHDGFSTIEEAIEKVESAMKAQYQPIRRETKETIRNFNKKCRKAERRITDIPEDRQYSQR